MTEGRSVLALATPPSETRLTTLARARRDLALPAEDADDDVLGGLIDTASAVIAAYLGQRRDDTGNVSLARADYDEIFRRGYADRRRRPVPLVLARTPVGAVVSVTEDGGETPALVEDADNPGALIANPAFAYETDKAAGVLWKLSGGMRINFTAASIAVRYSAGWVPPSDAPGAPQRTLPEDIEAACVLFVRRKFDQLREADNPRLKSESLPGAGAWQFDLQRVDWDAGLPSDVRAMLDPYRRLHV